MPLSNEDVMFGAAYRVVFERVNPDACNDQRARIAIACKITMMAEWVKLQPEPVAQAYTRAFGEIEKRADAVLENNLRHQQQIEAYGVIAKPPDIPA